MFENIQVFEKRYEELNQKLCDPTVLADPAVYAELMKEHKSITPIVEKYREYKHAEDAEAEALALLEESGLEKELRELAEQELEQAKKDIARTSDELKILLLPRDPNDEKNVIMEIRCRRRGSGALFRRPIPHVQHVCRAPRLADGVAQRE